MSISGKLIFTLCVFIVVAERPESRGNNYAMSIANMGVLFEYDEQLTDTLENYANLQEEIVQIMERYISDRRLEQAQAKNEGVEAYLGNPINSFSLMRRMHMDWVNWLWLIEYTGKLHMAKISALKEKMPSNKDITEGSTAMYRMQYIYELNTTEMALGRLLDVQYNTTLTPLDCYALAVYFENIPNYKRAEEWLKVTVDLYENDKENWEIYKVLGFRITEAYALYADVLMKQNKLDAAILLLKSALVHWPNDPILKLNYEKKNNLARIRMNENLELLTKPHKESKHSKYFEFQMNTCCRMECRNSFRLHCAYNTTASPFLRLAPVKTELLSLDPYVVVFHDIIYDSEIRELRYLAGPRLMRALTINITSRTQSEDPARTSKGTWLFNDHNQLSKRLTQRISDITQFETEISEPFQIMNYGIGGHYGPHLDYVNQTTAPDKRNGDRLATVLFYLNDVEQGGATSLPILNISVFPKKGSALMWLNLNNRGEGDNRTVHGACPVLVGSRWVMAKWIGELEQTFRRPCMVERGLGHPI